TLYCAFPNSYLLSSELNLLQPPLPEPSKELYPGDGVQALPWPMSPAAKRPAPRKKGRKVSLSLDVPTQVLSTLLELAREKELQAKAAANAELMARLGRRR
uniref:Corticotropin-releasing factor domain-containing protein n=1 Tax=Amazona collaria TaxID=241587 RepID=A0A8B9IX92_9PSIT